MGDIGPTQQRYEVLPLVGPVPAPVEAPREPVSERAAEPLVPAAR